MTMARIQPCLGKSGIDLGYFKGEETYPRTISNRIWVYIYTVITFV